MFFSPLIKSLSLSKPCSNQCELLILIKVEMGFIFSVSFLIFCEGLFVIIIYWFCLMNHKSHLISIDQLKVIYFLYLNLFVYLLLLW